MGIETDKLIHFFVSWGLFHILFFFTSYCVGVTRTKKRLAIACILTFSVGLVKELGDGWGWEWPWCRDNSCNPSWKDVFANSIGIFVGFFTTVNLMLIVQALHTIKDTDQQPSSLARLVPTLPITTTTTSHDTSGTPGTIMQQQDQV